MESVIHSPEYFVLPDSLEETGDFGELIGDYKFIREPTLSKTQQYLDTFDWRLYKKGLFLVREDNSFSLGDLQSGKPLANIRLRRKTAPKFWWDFPESSIQKELKPYLEMRALLTFLTLQSDIKIFRILNKDEKTVVRVKVYSLTAIGGGNESAAGSVMGLEPVKGYDKDYAEFRRYLFSQGLVRVTGDILSIAGGSVGVIPGDYTSKLNIALEPDMPASLAVKKIFLYLLDIMRRNEQGIKDDIDTEFLHDFRVAIRRTRSALSQIKGVFSDELTARYKTDFSNLGKMSNTLRDLDVYLLKEDQYRGMLPPELRHGLDPLFKKLAGQRKSTLRSTLKSMESDSFKTTLESWEKFLNSPAEPEDSGTNSSVTIIKLAKKHIWKKYNQIIKRGTRVSDESSDPELHIVRIECKKLRYLLEFFTLLFPADDMALIIKQLKRLQDNLGEFNDLSIQQESIGKFVEEYKDIDHNCAVASGGLISVLYKRQGDVRGEFSRRFKEFSDGKNKALMRKLFSNAK